MKTSLRAIVVTFVTFVFAYAGSFTAIAQIHIGSSGYFQDFNALSTGVPENWSLHTGATETFLGNEGAAFTPTPTSWGDSAGSFKNFASAGLSSAANPGTQSSFSDRALGIRQAAGFGDAGAAFVFNFSSSGTTLAAIELDLLMLNVQGRSTTWTIDYALGAAPTTFNTLYTWSDPLEFGPTSVTINSGLTALSDQSNVWLRIAALTPSVGSGSRDSIGVDNFSITAIPEPATYVVVCGAVALACAFVRRLRQRRIAADSFAG